jgi:hypothetical protein
MAERLLYQSEDEADREEEEDGQGWRDAGSDDEATDDSDTDSDDSYDSSSTEDEDDFDETRRFMKLISPPQTVRVELASGAVQEVQMPGHIRVTRVEVGDADRLRRERELERRRVEARGMELVATGAEKRKFGDRMSLEEAKRDDFENPEDYVDFLNAKLKNVNIKLCR